MKRHRRVRSKIKGTGDRPRVSVFKSNRNIFVQFIDDETGKTVLSSQIVSYKKNNGKDKKTEKAMKAGEMLAEKAQKAGIKNVVFDRGGFKYHGRVKAVADGLRKGNINF